MGGWISRVAYRGDSAINAAPIVASVSGLGRASKNAATGAMVQVHFLPSGMPLYAAVQCGADASVCGDCPQRRNAFKGQGKPCYVVPYRYSAHCNAIAGMEAAAIEAEALIQASQRPVRLGTYGNPSSAPFEVSARLVNAAGPAGHTGYDHRWRVLGQEWTALVMASVQSEAEAWEAWDLGFRSFRILRTGETAIRGREIVCPKSYRKGFTCDRCLFCNGRQGTADNRRSVAMPEH